MQYHQLGPTGLFVSRLCLGTMTFGGAGGGSAFSVIGSLTQSEADPLVAAALDAGVNFVDTANVYSAGESETILGRALGVKRKEVILATKLNGRMGPGVNDLGSSRHQVTAQVEASLKRLGTDYIDLYQIHSFDPVTPLEETLRALDDVVHAGKVRYIGCSNYHAWQIMKALGISEREGLEKFVSLQAYYSLAGRDLEHETVGLLQDQKLALLTWSPLAGGALSGKYTRANRANEGRRTKFDFPPIDVEAVYDIVDTLQKIAKKHDTSVATVALAWQLYQPFVTSVIIGAKTGAQLADNLKAVDVQLDAGDLAAIDAVSKPKPIYPGWMLKGTQGDRLPGQKRDWSAMGRSTF